MIVSASYRTDIPAFHGRWFINRLRAGWCRVVNPYGGRAYRVDLRREAVDGFVFWTRNAGPFMAALDEVRRRGYPFVVQYGINGYPKAIEPAVPEPGRAVEQARRIAGEFGPRVVVWRYDTIVFSTLTPRGFHLENFGRLARAMEGATDEVVVSFAQIYRKTRRNMDAAAQRAGFAWQDPPAEEKRELAGELARVAKAHGIRLTICSQRELLVAGAGDARCIDARRLEEIGGVRIAAKLKGNRADCGCYESRDIGAYDSCPAGCAYCYAVRDRDLAKRRLAGHDPDSEYLIASPGEP